jgi:hypothetical protein
MDLQDHLKANIFTLPITVQPQDKVGAPLCLLLQVLAYMCLPPPQALLIHQNLPRSHQTSWIHGHCTMRDPLLSRRQGDLGRGRLQKVKKSEKRGKQSMKAHLGIGFSSDGGRIKE